MAYFLTQLCWFLIDQNGYKIKKWLKYSPPDISRVSCLIESIIFSRHEMEELLWKTLCNSCTILSSHWLAFYRLSHQKYWRPQAAHFLAACMFPQNRTEGLLNVNLSFIPLELNSNSSHFFSNTKAAVLLFSVSYARDTPALNVLLSTREECLYSGRYHSIGNLPHGV